MKTFFKKYYFFIISIIFITTINCSIFRGKALDKNINFELYNKSKAPILCYLSQTTPEQTVQILELIVIPSGEKLGRILNYPGNKFQIHLLYEKGNIGIATKTFAKVAKNNESGRDSLEGLNAYEKGLLTHPDYSATIKANPGRKKIYLAFENNKIRPRQAQLGWSLNTSESGLSLSGNVKSNEISGAAFVSYGEN